MRNMSLGHSYKSKSPKERTVASMRCRHECFYLLSQRRCISSLLRIKYKQELQCGQANLSYGYQCRYSCFPARIEYRSLANVYILYSPTAHHSKPSSKKIGHDSAAHSAQYFLKKDPIQYVCNCENNSYESRDTERCQYKETALYHDEYIK